MNRKAELRKRAAQRSRERSGYRPGLRSANGSVMRGLPGRCGMCYGVNGKLMVCPRCGGTGLEPLPPAS